MEFLGARFGGVAKNRVGEVLRLLCLLKRWQENGKGKGKGYSAARVALVGAMLIGETLGKMCVS